MYEQWHYRKYCSATVLQSLISYIYGYNWRSHIRLSSSTPWTATAGRMMKLFWQSIPGARYISRVTEVGVTRCGKLTYFFLKKLTTFLFIVLWKVMKSYKVVTSFSYRLVITPTLSAFQRRFCSFFVNSAAKKLLSFGCHLLVGMTRDGPPPPLLVTTLRYSHVVLAIVLTI